MASFTNTDEILDFAIQNEQNAVDLYTELAAKAKSSAIKTEFEAFANEERGHKTKLQNVKAGRQLLDADTKIQDLKISDYTVSEALGDNPDYQSVLLFAMKQEKAAFKLYNDLAGFTNDATVKKLFLGLAQEEAKHKLRFEIEYDENILKEN